MKKIIKRINKIFMVIVMWLISFSNKALALPIALYGPPEPEVVKPTVTDIILGFIRIFTIPILILVGIIVYFKKSKTKITKKKKILIALGATIIIGFICDFIYKKF